MKLFSTRKKPGWMSIALTAQGVHLAYVLIIPNQKPIVQWVEWQALIQPDDAAIQSLVDKFDLTQYHCILVLAEDEYQLLQLEKPSVPDNELKQAVSWKLNDLINYPVEQATVEVLSIPSDPNNPLRQMFVYSVVARNSIISDYIQRFINVAQCGLEVINIAEMAQRNISACLEQEGRGLVMLSINNNDGMLTVTADGELYNARHIDIDLHQMQSEDSALKFSIFERISLEIQRSLDNFERQFPYIIINRLVLAPFMGRDDFYEYLKNALYIQVDCFDLTDVFVFERGLKLGNLGMQAISFASLGAALRPNKPT
jgi:MSHA biogenesis protein MshI